MFAVLFVPDFALQAALRHAPELRDAPVALIAERTPRARIEQCTAAARAAGVVAGMTPSQALARCAALQVRTRSPDAETSAQATLLDCAVAHSPFIEDTAPGVATMELKNARAFLAASFAAGAVTRMALLGLPARVGIAPDADLALLAAESAAEWAEIRGAHELAGLPVAALRPPAAMTDVLAAWGVRTLGEFVALGRERLVERLGAEVLPLFARATGNAGRPLRCVPPAETYEEAVDFESEVETLEPLLFMLRRFLDQIALRLEAAYLVGAEITLTIGFAAGEDHERAFRVPAPTANVDVLFRMLHTHLERFSAEHPITRLRISALPCRPARQQFALFEGALRDPNQFYETLARLTALLGDDRVGTPVVEDTHRPDAFRLHAIDFDAATTEDTRDEEGWAQTMALRRFRPPLPARVRFERRPVSLVSVPLRGAVIGAEGPFYSSGDWWTGEGWDRSEWDVQLAEGALCRIYQETEAWFLEGIYD